MGDPECKLCRVVGDYELGPRIGSGSFAVVWKSRHRQSGTVVAIKEIDKKHLNPKVRDNLLKEIEILRTIDHPNIIRLLQATETPDRIFLVLEYCDGGDLAAYINRRGRVTEAVARHFMRQLAAGLQVLQEKRLIHRDLKPQNLLLSTNGATRNPQLKIGDFGFARDLTQGLADTQCGSPLYMAPEIIQNQKYDAKADLWSVGAILFQLVTGKPPFDGNSQFQLFHNILSASEPQFPQGALRELHPDCVDLCRRLLRQNPVERLTFSEFFNHKFLLEPRSTADVEHPSLLPQAKPLVMQSECPRDKNLPAGSTKSPQLPSAHELDSSIRNLSLTCSSTHDVNSKMQHRQEQGSTSSKQAFVPSISHDYPIADSLELIEKEYVLVNAHFSSMETPSSSLEAPLHDSSAARTTIHPPKKNDQDVAVTTKAKKLTSTSIGAAESPGNYERDSSTPSCASMILKDVQELSVLHSSNRLHLLHKYAHAISELAQSKLKDGLFLESFSVQLVVLAIWKEAFRVCRSWLASTEGSDLPETSSTNESLPVQELAGLSLESQVDFSKPSSISMSVKRGFIAAFDCADKLSGHLRNMDGNSKMPDAMEIIFQAALTLGKSGAVDEYMDNKGSAAVSYSKAMLLLSFIIGEATLVPLNPPFSLTPANKNRIQRYITYLELHLTRFQI